jgi:predicted metalloprotease
MGLVKNTTLFGLAAMAANIKKGEVFLVQVKKCGSSPFKKLTTRKYWVHLAYKKAI